MAGHKRIDGICIVIVVITLMLTVLFMNGKALGISTLENGESTDSMFTANDLNGDWDDTGATRITLSGDSAAITGNGAYFYKGNVYIKYAGKYVVSGHLDDGSVVVDADGDDKIWLRLENVSLNAEDDAAIRVDQADKVFLTLVGENTLQSGKPTKENVDGTIYSKDDVTINGTGSLTVTAEDHHGIVCNDNLVITGGTLSVQAGQDAIHAHDSIRLCNADVTVSAGDDGLTVSNDDESAFLYMESGSVKITECYEGLEAPKIIIAGGTVDIFSEDDGLNASGSGQNASITITGGDITVLNSNGSDADGLDSNGDITITGGNLFVSLIGTGSNSALDYGEESGGTCTVSGGTVIACGGSRMACGFDASSEQAFLMQTVSATKAGDTLTVADADGKVILSRKIPYSFTNFVVSAPELSQGETYTVTTGETVTQIKADNSSASGGFGGMGQKDDRSKMPQNGTDAERGQRPQDGKNFSREQGQNGGMRPNRGQEQSGEFQPPQMPGGGDTSKLPQMPDGAIPGEMPTMPENNKNNPNERMQMPGEPTNTQDTMPIWILIGASVLILIGGLLIATKKKC